MTDPVYEIFRISPVCRIRTPFSPPLRVGTLETLRLVAPIIERTFGAVEVLYGGHPFDWRETAAKSKAKGAA